MEKREKRGRESKIGKKRDDWIVCIGMLVEEQADRHGDVMTW